MTHAEHEAVARILAACPSQKMSTEARVLSKVKPAPQHPPRSAESKTAVPPASAALKYANCATLMGMVDPGAVDHTSGTPVTDCHVTAEFYNANIKSDRDDGIPCEAY